MIARFLSDLAPLLRAVLDVACQWTASAAIQVVVMVGGQ